MKTRKSILLLIIIVTAVSFLYRCASESSDSAEDLSGWSDIHGAGAQRSDPKSGDFNSYTSLGNGYYNSIAPQGDAVRIDNYVRLVRTESSASDYSVVDTAQTLFYNDTTTIDEPLATTDRFYGQDAHFRTNEPNYTVSSDSLTVYDNNTELTWMRSPNSSGTTPVTNDKMTYTDAQSYVEEMNNSSYGGYSDWRIPSIKELYSLIIFSGLDVSGYEGSDTSSLVPFIDTAAFNFDYGDPDSGERIIDSQYLSSNTYISTEYEALYFGVNFADGRIKGYGARLGPDAKTFFVQLVRGNSNYGINEFLKNGDETITDAATGLMWTQNDSGEGMSWEEALAWVQTKNSANYLGYSDWRLPNAKELHTIVEYSNAPGYNEKPAINTEFFDCTEITNEKYETDYPWYWSSTTHASMMTSASGSTGVYFAFGRAMGYSSESTEMVNE